MLARSRSLIGSQLALFVILALWSFGPLAELVANVTRHGGVLVGTNGFDAYDQLAYLAWIRDSGSHFLASNLWDIAPSAHDYLQPMYFISGLLWRLGVGIQLAYLVWKPVALLVLFLGFSAYVRHVLPGSRLQQTAALALALFYLSPALPLASWTNHLTFGQRLDLMVPSNDADAALNLWGFDHAAITIGLMPVFLIAIEKLIAIPTGRRGWMITAALAGLLVSWLHPWQGVMLLAIVGGVILLTPGRRLHIALYVTAAATLAPLIYGVLLSRLDPSWRAFQAKTIAGGGPPLWALLASLGPLAVFAALGLRRPHSPRDWLLLGWIASCAAVYVVIPEFPPHALSGITLPLSVLAVRGWSRFSLRHRLAWPAAVTLIAAFTIPGVVYFAQGARDDVADPSHAYLRQLLVLTPDQAAALAYISASPRAGGVLAPVPLTMTVPAMTGHPVYAGHLMWQPARNTAIASEFFDPELKGAAGPVRRRILLTTQAVFVLADCGAPPKLASQLAPIAPVVKRFGCVTVYERNRVRGR